MGSYRRGRGRGVRRRAHLVSRRSCCAVSESRSAAGPSPRTPARAPCRWTWRRRPARAQRVPNAAPLRRTITPTALIHQQSLKLLHNSDRNRDLTATSSAMDRFMLSMIANSLLLDTVLDSYENIVLLMVHFRLF